MTLLPKTAVDYAQGTVEAHCGLCRHHEAASSTCEIVAGPVYAADWCRRFDRASKLAAVMAEGRYAS